LLPEPPQAPLGADVWGDTRLPLPEIPVMRWTNLFTGERLDPATRNGIGTLAAGDVFRDFPVALLLAQAR
jgi:maltooligosyltrehalose synthase